MFHRACRDASEKSTGQRIRLIGAIGCFKLRVTIGGRTAEDAELYTVELPVTLRQIWTSHLFPLVAEPHDGVGGCGDLVPVGARKTPA